MQHFEYSVNLFPFPFPVNESDDCHPGNIGAWLHLRTSLQRNAKAGPRWPRFTTHEASPHLRFPFLVAMAGNDNSGRSSVRQDASSSVAFRWQMFMMAFHSVIKRVTSQQKLLVLFRVCIRLEFSPTGVLSRATHGTRCPKCIGAHYLEDERFSFPQHVRTRCSKSETPEIFRPREILISIISPSLNAIVEAQQINRSRNVPRTSQLDN